MGCRLLRASRYGLVDLLSVLLFCEESLVAKSSEALKRLAKRRIRFWPRGGRRGRRLLCCVHKLVRRNRFTGGSRRLGALPKECREAEELPSRIVPNVIEPVAQTE